MMIGVISTEEMVLRLGIAALLGAVLGLDRELRGRAAGIRTHAIVALSSAVTTISALMLSHEMRAEGVQPDPLRVVQGLAQAIGFICAGLIFVRGGDVKNMTTAANLWMSAALGVSVGLGHYLLVGVAAVLTLVLLTVARVVERRITKTEPPSESDKPS